jgi:coenzyme F420-reducing hydrogenase gamma subunit
VNNKEIPCYNLYSTEITAPDGTIKTFCPNHVREEVKKFKIEIQKKKLEDKMKAKELKQKEKEEKKQAKLAIKTTNADVLEPTQLCMGCNVILKSGPRKGTECGVTIYENNMCKRHHNKNPI